ncbi:MAG TPA: hypothetical protein VEC16_05945, partial [Alphaproteobacteria bacterium]|nr:hypothetical protein [Alphaproteobacteria bacterium]
MSISSKLKDLKNGFFYTLKHTSAEVFIGVALGGLAAGIWSYDHENDKNKIYRLGFSEIRGIEKMQMKHHLNVPNMTEFLCKTNDFYMKILESHNESWHRSFLDDNTRSFAQELEFHKDITFKQYHYELPQLNAEVPALADSLMKDLKNVVAMKKHIDYTLVPLEKTWDEYHHDEYHTEIYFEDETYTDSDGKEHTRTVMKTKQVYDYTDNKYDYYKKEGEESAKLLDHFRDYFPKVTIDTLFIVAKETGAENEWAIEKSHRYDYENNNFPEENYLKIANSWAAGSHPHQNLEKIMALQYALIQDANKWDVDKKNAKSSFIRTYDESRPRPEELKTIRSAESHGEDISALIGAMVQTIDYTKQNVPSLMKKVDAYIAATLDYKEKDEGKISEMKKEIISETMQGYARLFPNAIDVERA